MLCATSGVIGSIAGMILGSHATSPSRIARWISAIYINLIRGIPILVIIFFIFFGLPLLFPDLDLSKFASAVIALSVFAAATLRRSCGAASRRSPRAKAKLPKHWGSATTPSSAM